MLAFIRLEKGQKTTLFRFWLNGEQFHYQAWKMNFSIAKTLFLSLILNLIFSAAKEAGAQNFLIAIDFQFVVYEHCSDRKQNKNKKKRKENTNRRFSWHYSPKRRKQENFRLNLIDNFYVPYLLGAHCLQQNRLVAKMLCVQLFNAEPKGGITKFLHLLFFFVFQFFLFRRCGWHFRLAVLCFCLVLTLRGQSFAESIIGFG